jgi:hypothetical protein
VVAGEHDGVLGVLANHRIEEDGVGGAEIPVLADALLRQFGKLAALLRDDVPHLADVPVQRERLVLVAMKMRRPESMQSLR